MRLENPLAWRERKLAVLPSAWYRRALKKHDALGGIWNRDANGWLLDLSERMGGIRVPLGLTDAEICALADKCAREAMSLADAGRALTVEEYRAKLGRFCTGYGITPPEPERISARTGKPVGVSDTGAIRRMTDAQWWRRALRRTQARALEREAIGLGYVHRRGEIYASDVTVERRAAQKRRNAATLDGTEAVNLDTGEVYSLAELAEKAVSNPRIRRGELMTRIAGFEGVAQGLGHVAEFWTATCPSRMHPKRTAGNGRVLDNPKYDGTTPKEAQSYLGKVWANFRAAAWRRGMRFYGFRIAEPHHDATPHWHLLLFMPAMLDAARRTVPRLRALFRSYFLRDSKGEAGARRARCEFVSIDPARGTAAGYIAKYVSKNIDGYQVQGDLEGENLDAVTGSQRVEAWASTWGIRQFQQVGGPPVGVWRELRRMPRAETYGEELEGARSAADAGNWRRYVEVMGGPVVKRDALPLRTAYTREGERWNASEGAAEPAPLTRYGETARAAVFGVREVARDLAHCSRFFRWEITRARKSTRGFDFGVTAKPLPPWTRVNNCSQVRTVKDGEGWQAPRETEAERETRESFERMVRDGRGIEPFGAGFTPEIRHGARTGEAGGDAAAARRAAVDRATGGNHRGDSAAGRAWIN